MIMKKRLVILLLVFTFVFSFAISVFTNEAGNKGPTVDLEERKLDLSAPPKKNIPGHTPPARNPIDVAGA